MIDLGTKRLETKRLVLRKAVLDDYKKAFINWTSDPKVSRYVTWDTHQNDEVTKEYFKYVVSRYDEPNCYNWIVCIKEIDEPIGQIDVVNIVDNSNAVIGYCFSSLYWNQGFATEAFKEVIKYLFDEVKFNKISAYHLIDNPASGKVMIKCGLKCIDQKKIITKGIEKEALYYEIENNK